MLRAAVLAIAMTCVALPAASDTPAPKGAKVYFINLKDGDTVSSPVLVQFGLKGMGIAPAGVEFPDTGHHHLLVDQAAPDLKEYLPTDHPQILHYGKGQTEVELKLPAGKHTLQLIFADQDHKAHVPPVMSEKITITVK
jgi:hypothetical protein